MADQIAQGPLPANNRRRDDDPRGEQPTELMTQHPPAPHPLALPPAQPGQQALPPGAPAPTAAAYTAWAPGMPYPAAPTGTPANAPVPGTPQTAAYPGAPATGRPPATAYPPAPAGAPTSRPSANPPPSAAPAGAFSPAAAPGTPPTTRLPDTPPTTHIGAPPPAYLPAGAQQQTVWPPSYPAPASQPQPTAQAAPAANTAWSVQPATAAPAATAAAEPPLLPKRWMHIVFMVGLIVAVVWAIPTTVFGVWSWRLGQQHQPPPVLANLRAAGQSGNQLQWSPDGQYLAEQITLPGGQVGDPNGSAVILWDVKTGREVRRFTGADGGLALAWSPDSALLATTDGSHVLIWRALEIEAAGDAVTPAARLNAHSQDTPITSLAWSKDTQTLAVADEGGLDIFAAAGGGTWKQKQYLSDSACASSSCNRALSWSPDGAWLLIAPWHDHSASGIGVWDAQTWQQAPLLNASAALAWSSDSSLVLVRAGDETTLQALRAGSWSTSWTINPNQDLHQGYNVYPQAAGWSPDNKWLVGSADGWVDLWPLATRHSLWVWNEQQASQQIYTVNSLAWSPDSHTLAITTDGTANITLYNLRNPAPPA